MSHISGKVKPANDFFYRFLALHILVIRYRKQIAWLLKYKTTVYLL